MDVQLTPAGAQERERLTALFQLYAYDFSDLLGLDVGDDGRFKVPPLEPYFTDSRCHAFLIRADDEVAGFALVQQRSRLSGDESVYDMAQFFVMRRYRRHGIGERAAGWIFDRFRGPWEVREAAPNHAAAAFWRRIIGRYTGGRFEELLLDDDRWHGPVQRFDSRL